MPTRDELERRALDLAARLTAELVESAEDLDSRMGTYLLVALSAELGQRAQNRCYAQARAGGPAWEVAAAEAETLINAAWRCMETVSALSDQFRPSVGPGEAGPV